MYNNKDKLCIVLSSLLSASAAKLYSIAELLCDSNGLQDKLKLHKNEIAELIGQKQFEILLTVNDFFIEALLSRYANSGVICITVFSEDYPNLLKNISDPPLTLFCKGNTKLLNTSCFGVVGTRKTSAYSKRVTENFTFSLANVFTVVSGLAFGVDSIAHETTLTAGGKTIAVLGGGFDNIYPAANRGLAERILRSEGLLLSEYAPHVDPLAYHFPQRNRIVAGLCKGLLVCAAPLKSGTFSTVNCALEQGRDVFVVPGEIYDYTYLGSNKLISSMQGAMVTSPNDILDCYNFQSAMPVEETVELDNNERVIVNNLLNGKKHFNELVASVGLNPSEINILLANLQFRGIISKSAGNFYQLNGGIK
ncbi:MAG: DNA-processing protein DprA [Corallococcus sp.]|nr:DNA-processing protein DprA [Corallococcus sp.]